MEVMEAICHVHFWNHLWLSFLCNSSINEVYFVLLNAFVGKYVTNPQNFEMKVDVWNFTEMITYDAACPVFNFYQLSLKT